MAIYHIAGDWSEHGYLAGRDRLPIDVHADGKITDPDTRAYPLDELYCRQYGNDCPIITNGVWEFMVDPDELTRIGVTPTQMIEG
jgi:hypothetical protein